MQFVTFLSVGYFQPGSNETLDKVTLILCYVMLGCDAFYVRSLPLDVLWRFAIVACFIVV